MFKNVCRGVQSKRKKEKKIGVKKAVAHYIKKKDPW